MAKSFINKFFFSVIKAMGWGLRILWGFTEKTDFRGGVNE